MKFKNDSEKSLWESAIKSYLAEGQNEDLTKNMLDKAGRSDAFTSIIEVDPTTKNKYAPVIAQFFIDGVALNSLEYIFDKMPEIEKKAGISPQRTKKGVFWNKDNEKVGAKSGVPMDFIKFSESVDSIDSIIKGADAVKNAGKGQPASIKNADGTDPNLVFNKNGIKIFESYSQGACVTYSKGQSFCIGNASGGMYNTYRKDKDSSFHFVFDESAEYPLQTVVVDKTKNGIELTDETNKTGTIQNPNGPGKGDYTNDYMSYLQSKGVDMSVFKNNKYTKVEKKLNDLVSERYGIEEFKEKILGKTQEMPNGDVVDLTLEWLIHNSNERGLSIDIWNEIRSNPITKGKAKDYEWRLSTGGFTLLGSVLDTFSQGNINKYVASHGGSNRRIHFNSFNRASDEVKREYVLKKAMSGEYLPDELFGVISEELKKEYLDLYTLEKGKKGEEVIVEILEQLSEESRQRFLELYLLDSASKRRVVEKEYLDISSEGLRAKYWDTFFKSHGFASADEYILNKMEKGGYINPVILELLSEDMEGRYIKNFLRGSGSSSIDDYFEYRDGSGLDDEQMYVFNKAGDNAKTLYTINNIKKGGPMPVDLFKMLPENARDLYVTQKTIKGFGLDKEILDLVSDNTLQKYFKEMPVNFIKKMDGKIDPETLERYVSRVVKYAYEMGFDVMPEALDKASPDIQQKYKETKGLNESFARIIKEEVLLFFENTQSQTKEGFYDAYIDKARYPKLPVANIFKNKQTPLGREVRMGADEYIDNKKFETLPVKEVRVEDIVPTQRMLTVGNLEKAHKDMEDETGAYLLKIQDKYYVLDGHHRIANKITSGEDSVKAYVYEDK